MANELKPCPFCGSDRITVHNIRDGKQAVCNGCGAMGRPRFHGPEGRGSTRDKAAEAWNARSAAPVAPVEGLETVSHMAKTRTGWIITPSYSGQPVVTKSQAEAIIAAEREAQQRLLDIIEEANTDKEALETQHGAARKALERAAYGFDQVHKSLMSNSPKQASGEVTAFFLAETNATLEANR